AGDPVVWREREPKDLLLVLRDLERAEPLLAQGRAAGLDEFVQPPLGGQERLLLVLRRDERRHELVVLARRQGIELVIVAAGAAHREGEEGLAGRADQVVEL